MSEIITDMPGTFFGGHRYLKSAAVMALLGYRNRASFWAFVRHSGVPHVRLNARRIMFEEQALLAWLARRSSCN